jgi:hypothetical protein
MAKAPTPGVSRRAEAVDAAKQITRITVKGETLDVAIGNLPMTIKNRVRKQCDGLPLSAFWSSSSSIDEDSLIVLWWVARMVNGENALTLQAVEESWPDDLTADDLAMEVVNVDDIKDGEDSPES